MLNFNESDRQMYTKLELFTRWVFIVAEYVLIFGVFSYLAYFTNNPIVILVAVILGLLLTQYIWMTGFGLRFFVIRRHQKVTLITNLLFGAVVYTLFLLVLAQVFETYKDGLGL